MKDWSMDYQPEQQVLIIVKDPDKLVPHTLALYQIEMVHVKGTVTIEQATNIFERTNIRRIQPYRSD